MKALIAKKIGMTQIFDESGRCYPATILDTDAAIVSRRLPNHVELGFGKRKTASKALTGQYKELGFVPVATFIIKSDNDTEQTQIGTRLSANIFAVGEYVDITGVTKGKGFQGVVKRWGFSGGPKTHGQSDKQRHPGSIGERMTPGRVFKGQRMGGHMGNVRQTTQKLKVIKVDNDNNFLVIAGAVPGNSGGIVLVRPSVKARKGK